jgi:hypothetical protein
MLVNVADADCTVLASINGIKNTRSGRQTGLVSSIAGPRRIVPKGSRHAARVLAPPPVPEQLTGAPKHDFPGD